MLKKLRIGISGIGSIGLRHAGLLAERREVELVICDPCPQSLEQAGVRIKNAEFMTSFEKMLDSGLDGVVIAAPDRFHIEQLEAARANGVAVLMEKPLAENYGQGRCCFEKLGAAAEKVLIGYILRFSTVVRKTKEFIDRGLIGTPVSFQAMLGAYETLVVAKNRFSASEENKLFVDYSHEWDYTGWLLGEYESVAAVKHQSGKLELYQNPNVVDCLVKLHNGITGTVHLDYVQFPSERSIVVIGDKGTLKADMVTGGIAVKNRADTAAKVYDCGEPRNNAFIREHDNFIGMIRENSSPLVSFEDGLRALAVAQTAIASSETGLWRKVQK